VETAPPPFDVPSRAWHPLDGLPLPHEPPSRWHAGWVAVRLILGYQVLLSVPARFGPAGVPQPWPEILHEFADLVTWRRELRARQKSWLTWSAGELATAEEAVGWPLRFLGDSPHRAEAVQVWALTKASRRSLKAVLRSRQANRIRQGYRICSDTSLRRYLGPGLETLAQRLETARIPVR
jgi:hypothetical protein